MTYIVQASPLTRIRLPEWQARCLENPKLLYDPAPFIVHIPRASGDIVLTHKKVVLANDLISRGGARIIEDDEVSPLVSWLTDVYNYETDMYGVVEIRIKDEVADTIMALMIGSDAENLQQVIKDTQSRMKKDFAEAQKIADERVMRACGKMYNVVKLTMEDMKKNNKGTYSASFSEALAFEVMSETIKKRRIPDIKAQEMVDRAMDKMADPLGLENRA